MARTESNAIPLGTVAPDFKLLDVRSNKVLTRDQIFAADPKGCPRLGLLVMFVCVHCPFVMHVEEALGRIGVETYGRAGEGPLAIAAISSNDVDTYPQDAPDHMRYQAERCGWTFPYLYDESQEVAKAYHAACTPDVYLFDRDLKLVYHGQIDSTRPAKYDEQGRNIPSTGDDLRNAIQALFKHQPPLETQTPSLGCNIKWKDA